jgi:uncharacterized protein
MAGGEMYIARTMEAHVKSASQQFPVVLLTGARQVGKTTLLRHLAGDERRYVTLDDPLARSLANDDPGLFMTRFAPPVLIDEMQYAPGLLSYVKMSVDEGALNGSFWLTGSQPFHLMRGVSESLAGRVAVVQLMGLSQQELRGNESHPFVPTLEYMKELSSVSSAEYEGQVFGQVFQGCLPAYASGAVADRELFFGSYVQTYLQRDIRDLARVGDEAAFLRFLRAVAARTGQLLNLADLARDVDIAPNTAKSWLSILEVSGVLYLLEPYHSNLTKRLVKAPKIHFLDTGLGAYLCRWMSPETLEAGAMAGAMLESWAVAEVLKGFRHNGREAPLYFYRDRDGREVDLLVVSDGTIHPVEIKLTGTPRTQHVRNFAALSKLDLPVGPGCVLNLSTTPMPLTKNAWSIPLHLL